MLTLSGRTVEREPAGPRPAPDPLRQAFDAQRAAWTVSPPDYAQRIEALVALEHSVTRHRRDIIDSVAEDFGGRAADETLALELLPLQNELRYARRHLQRWMSPQPVRVQWQFWPARARVVHQPLGVVGVLSPWNCPFFLGLAPLAGILAAGNHALLKPSELAPASAALIREIVAEAFPPEYVSVVCGGESLAARFARLPFDHLLFTGSARVGRLVMQAASEQLVPVTLELGGKSPAIVHPEYPMVRAAERIATGKLFNAGQTCVAPDYVLVPEGRADEFVDHLRAAATRMYPALVSNPDYTRIINAPHYRRLLRLVDDAQDCGARVDVVNPRGERCDAGNRVFPPTFVTGVSDGMALMQEEIFGPLLPIVEYRTLDEAIHYVSHRPRPLAAYYFDHSRVRADHVVARVAAGGITVNDCLLHVAQPGLPFGGVGASGMGRYHGFDGFQTFSNRVGVLTQRRWSPLAWLRPPYGPGSRRLLETLLR
jgi:coniferyl-aldehyde dehydrogenase